MFGIFSTMFAWMQGLPAFFRGNKWALWVGAGLVALMGHKIQVRNARLKGVEAGERKANEEWRARIDEANAETEKKIDDAREAGEAIDKELLFEPHDWDGDGKISSDDLNRSMSDVLSDRAGDDPRNRGPVVRGSGTD